MNPKNKRIILFTFAPLLLLFIPLIGALFTLEIDWKFSDYIIAGSLLGATGLFIELTTRLVKQPRTRIALLIGIMSILLLIWVELAVGLFGTPFAGS